MTSLDKEENENKKHSFRFITDDILSSLMSLFPDMLFTNENSILICAGYNLRVVIAKSKKFLLTLNGDEKELVMADLRNLSKLDNDVKIIMEKFRIFRGLGPSKQYEPLFKTAVFDQDRSWLDNYLYTEKVDDYYVFPSLTKIKTLSEEFKTNYPFVSSKSKLLETQSLTVQDLMDYKDECAVQDKKWTDTDQKPIVINEVKLEMKNVRFFGSGRLLIIKSNCGTGKTKLLFLHIWELPPNVPVLIITYRKSLIKKIEKELSDYGFVSYLGKDEQELNSCNRIVITPDSLHKLDKNKTWPIVILEETTHTLAHWHACIRYHMKAQIFEALSTFLSKAKDIVALDANMNSLGVRTLKSMCVNKPCDYYVNKAKRPNAPFVKRSPDEVHLMLAILAEIKTGRPFVVACNSINFAKRLEILLTRAGRKVLVYTSKQRHPDLNVDDWIVYNVVVFTSVLEAGISFEKAHFHTCFGYFTSQTTTAWAAFQQLHRVRDVKLYHLCIVRGTSSILEKLPGGDRLKVDRIVAQGDYLHKNDPSWISTWNLIERTRTRKTATADDPIVLISTMVDERQHESLRDYAGTLIDLLLEEGCQEINTIVNKVARTLVPMTREIKNPDIVTVSISLVGDGNFIASIIPAPAMVSYTVGMQPGAIETYDEKVLEATKVILRKVKEEVKVKNVTELAAENDDDKDKRRLMKQLGLWDPKIIDTEIYEPNGSWVVTRKLIEESMPIYELTEDIVRDYASVAPCRPDMERLSHTYGLSLAGVVNMINIIWLERSRASELRAASSDNDALALLERGQKLYIQKRQAVMCAEVLFMLGFKGYFDTFTRLTSTVSEYIRVYFETNWDSVQNLVKFKPGSQPEYALRSFNTVLAKFGHKIASSRSHHKTTYFLEIPKFEYQTGHVKIPKALLKPVTRVIETKYPLNEGQITELKILASKLKIEIKGLVDERERCLAERMEMAKGQITENRMAELITSGTTLAESNCRTRLIQIHKKLDQGHFLQSETKTSASWEPSELTTRLNKRLTMGSLAGQRVYDLVTKILLRKEIRKAHGNNDPSWTELVTILGERRTKGLIVARLSSLT